MPAHTPKGDTVIIFQGYLLCKYPWKDSLHGQCLWLQDVQSCESTLKRSHLKKCVRVYLSPKFHSFPIQFKWQTKYEKILANDKFDALSNNICRYKNKTNITLISLIYSYYILIRTKDNYKKWAINSKRQKCEWLMNTWTSMFISFYAVGIEGSICEQNRRNSLPPWNLHTGGTDRPKIRISSKINQTQKQLGMTYGGRPPEKETFE